MPRGNCLAGVVEMRIRLVGQKVEWPSGNPDDRSRLEEAVLVVSSRDLPMAVRGARMVAASPEKMQENAGKRETALASV
ncbi:MAG: hypothetical protein ABW133_24880, partial [Polyangiaceae bacterium]